MTNEPTTPREIALWSAVYAAAWTHYRVIEKRPEHICHAVSSEEANRALRCARGDWK